MADRTAILTEAEANLHEVMAANAGEDGVLLGSGAWIVTARR